MHKSEKYCYKPLPEPILITEQQWPEETLPLVTTRTITYMHEPYIRECIEGILMQKTTFPVEIVIHDDASTDKTADIVREYEAKHPRLIKAIYQKENQFSKPGKGTMREDINKAVLGKYLALCEGDDYWTDPLKLQKQVEFLEANPEYGACFTNATFLNEIEKTSIVYVTNLKEGDVPIKDIILAGGYIFPTASIVYKRDIPDLALSQKVTNLAGDTLLIFSLATKSKVFFMNEITCVYRRWSGGIYSNLVNKKNQLIKFKINELNGYLTLNSYTNSKYSKHIKIKISQNSLNILKCNLDINKLFLLKYLTIPDFFKLVLYQLNKLVK